MSTKPRVEALRDAFVFWQCMLRAEAMRRLEGRPTPGMRPRVLSPDGTELAPALTTLPMRKEPQQPAAAFRHLVRRTHDPRERRDAAVALLAERYYAHPSLFSDVLTATFPPHSPLANALIEAGTCRLVFEQDGRHYDTPCAVTALAPADAHWQATWWHNALFNAALPPDIRVLAFKPRWLDTLARRTGRGEAS